MNRKSKLLKTQMKMGYWPGFTMAMYPSQFAYAPIKPEFERIWKDRKEINLYYHIPFCKSICPYCGFFTIAQNDKDYIRKYVDKLNQQAVFYGNLFGETVNVKSICFGGGTPNHAPIEAYDDIFNTLHKINVKMDEKLEPSMEVSPELLTKEYISDLKRIGIRRLSLGVQSLNLNLREAIHRDSNYSILSLVDIMRKNEMNINIDVINGLRGQTSEMFMDTLEKLMEFKPETISIYPLAGKDSSMLKQSDQIMTSKEKYDLFRLFYDYLIDQGYYCESNVKFIRCNQNSTHQQKIYEYQGVDTLGIGCAARSYNFYTHYSTESEFNGKGRKQLLDDFITKDFSDLTWFGIDLDEQERKSRFGVYGMFIGKLDTVKYKNTFGSSFEADFGEELEAVLETGLADINDKGEVLLTQEGRVYTDIICQMFWSDKINEMYKNIK